MNTIKIKVTQKVLDQTAKSMNQEQIALSSIPKELAYCFQECTRSNKKTIILANSITLVLGDTSSIWRAHNNKSKDFDNLYTYLSSYPDKEFTFTCEMGS
ncbi:hypothetical protein F9L16_23400 [Agarivorans sp. B2Z047]|uniref:hypothetical protein n=1 Tax=Agarivorans sp. B2Z047 TaxID=2652721 RepID=UPI00128C946B|nr:hypothetical protein [Agarivorans sp. B2Z047]MPW31905.1 hypothetical protein [Agarivorans sp. B2Z047]UQN44873.1 hypothetical protein LQZ07_10535 [Agarivorans sp. B2Z047]